MVGGVGTGRERLWIFFLKKTIIEFAINVVEGKENFTWIKGGGERERVHTKPCQKRLRLCLPLVQAVPVATRAAPIINPCKRIATSSSSSSHLLKKVCSSWGEEELRAESPDQQQQLLYIIVYFVNVRCSSSCCTVAKFVVVEHTRVTSASLEKSNSEIV